MNNFLSPPEIADYTIEAGMKKSTLPIYKMLMLGFLAGAFIALASEGSNIATHTIESIGIAKLIAGVLFPAGLMFVVICGGELFTGNCLIIMSCLHRKSKWTNFIKNLFFVYIGNLIGSIFVVVLIYSSGQLNYTLGALGGYTIKVAANKVNLSFLQAFTSGVLCNWLVCLAVWTAYGAKDMSGKILGIFFPIFLFILSGFEHCVANMYYIPAGLISMNNPDYLNQAIEIYHVSQASLENLTLSGFFLKNLLPVTLGNVAGGGIFVGVFYYLIYKFDHSQIPKIHAK